MIPHGNQYPDPAWNALPYGLSIDAQAPGNSRTIPAGDSPDGQLNLGQNMYSQAQIPGMAQRPAYGVGDVRGILQAMLGQHQQGAAQFNPGIRPQTAQPISGFGPGSGHQMPWDMHHAQVSAAANLARFLAQQHTAGLRRFQYNGRH